MPNKLEQSSTEIIEAGHIFDVIVNEMALQF